MYASLSWNQGRELALIEKMGYNFPLLKDICWTFTGEHVHNLSFYEHAQAHARARTHTHTYIMKYIACAKCSVMLCRGVMDHGLLEILLLYCVFIGSFYCAMFWSHAFWCGDKAREGIIFVCMIFKIIARDCCELPSIY